MAHDLAVSVALRLRALVPGITFALERLVEGAARARSLDSMTVVGFEPAYDRPGRGCPGWRAATSRTSSVAASRLGRRPAEGTGHDSDSLLALAEAEFAEALHITHSGTKEVLIEIMAGEIDKGIGFLEVAELRGIESGSDRGGRRHAQ